MVNRTSPPLDGPRGRLLALAQERGVSLAGLSDLIGRNPTYLQQFIRKGSPRRLEEDDRRKLAAFFGIAEEELRDVQEKSYSLAPGAAALGEWVDVPRLELDASAGPGAMDPGEERAFGTLRFSRRWLAQQGLTAAHLSAISVAGDSMEPVLNDGDEILVDCSARPFRDGIYVVRFGETLLVKRVAQAGAGRLALLSQNLAYPPIEVGVEDVDIIGRVVWKGGRV